MRRLSTTTRITITLVSLLVSACLLAQATGILPDENVSILKQRATLCEALALQCSYAPDIETARATAVAMIARHADAISAGLRTKDGTLLFDVNSHGQSWHAPPDGKSTPTQMQIPILHEGQPWGTLELAFAPMGPGGFKGLAHNPVARTITFLALVCFIGYGWYLRRTLKQLDPSSVIPDRIRVVLDALAEGVLVLDSKEQIVLANRAFCRDTGIRSEELQGRRASSLRWLAPQTDKPVKAVPWNLTLADGSVQTGVYVSYRSGDQRLRNYTVNCAPILGSDGMRRGALATFDDVTTLEEKNTQLQTLVTMLEESRDEVHRQNRELQSLAMTDSLTGCLNRRAFFSTFDDHWSAARRHSHPMAAAMLDVDHFKKINDRHGHAIGDQVLQRLAAILKELSRNSDVVCRYGGEEFCVLLPYTNLTSAMQTAERFRCAIESQLLGGVSATVSVGVSAMEGGASSPQDLLNQADQALYAAKRGGRNRVEAWNPAMATVPPPDRGESRAPERPGSDPISFRAVAALMSALAQRDKATAAHSRRVADLCVAAAQGLMSVSDCFILEAAALLHDIGKLGVPDSILLKPGPLSEEEWRIMRMHERLGAEIVAATFNSPQLTEIVRTHHCFYALSDRPVQAPAGDNIPLGSRILTIVDAYDAMVSNRPYKPARSKEEAFAELRRCAGTQFDPQLVERIVQVINARTEGGAPASRIDELFGGIQRDLERLATALDAQDLALLAAMAGRFSSNASRDGLEHISAAAKELENAASAHPDVAEVVAKLNELMELCRSADKVQSSAPTSSPQLASR